MIYTVTLNPSLDYIVTMDCFALGRTNRTTTERLLPGGKGINVSTVLSNLGVDNVALGFLAGFVGEEIRRKVEERGLRHEFIQMEGACSRINIKLKDFDGTEINGKGPAFDARHLKRLLERLDALEAGDGLVLAGSAPSGLPENVYAQMLERVSGKEAWTVVDASGGLLREALAVKPFLIKPNLRELGELFGKELTTWEEALFYAGKLQEWGAANVLVSMGGKGAVLADALGGKHRLAAPEGKLVNAVGAGDSMVAGFLAACLGKGKKKEVLTRADYEQALRLGVAAGSASAFSEELANKRQVLEAYRRLGPQESA